MNELKTERMENENKEVIRLTDEELKEVTGGAVSLTNGCEKKRRESECIKTKICRWKDGKCIL